ncbi:hypothetical protein BDQ17DRAFT_1432328 [Cyathus striatus]|nr:hypothetical protein BDQ17DRAFT_1432328 [Cyathus striatus]
MPLQPSPNSRATRDRHNTCVDRTRLADPNQGRCLVENCSIHRAIEYCHVMQRTWTFDKPNLMDSLEWFWRMRKGSLNLDSRYNIFPAGISAHRMFDAKQWIMVPHKDIVQKYYDSIKLLPGQVPEGTEYIYRRKTFPEVIEGEIFEYRLVPIQDMQDIAFTRQNDIMSPVLPNMFKVHTYPFDTLPTFFSHIQPKFVIVEAGDVLVSSKYHVQYDHVKQDPVIVQIMSIYQAWSTEVDDLDVDDEGSYYPPDPPEDDRDATYRSTNSGHTVKRRLTEKSSTQGTPALPSRKSQRTSRSGSGRGSGR